MERWSTAVLGGGGRCESGRLRVEVPQSVVVFGRDVAALQVDQRHVGGEIDAHRGGLRLLLSPRAKGGERAERIDEDQRPVRGRREQ